MVGPLNPSKIHVGPVSGALAVIPSRFAATRFPGKPLALLKGTPVIVHVARRAKRCESVGAVLVATDDRRIYDTVRAAGFEVVMTSGDHPSGTDRVVEAARGRNEEIIVNIQGDEPMIDTSAVDAAVRALESDPSLNMATLATPIRSAEEFNNPNAVKVVMDGAGRALYFSRAPIPHHRGNPAGFQGFKHLGLYVYRRGFLIKFASMEPSPLEKAEQLEQLRALQRGERIHVVITQNDSIGIDTPEDLARAEMAADV